MSYRDQFEPSFAGTASALPTNTQNFASMLSELRATDAILDRMVQIQEYSPRETIATPSELAETMYVVMEGSVHLVCSSDSRLRFNVTPLEPGPTFGPGALAAPAID